MKYYVTTLRQAQIEVDIINYKASEKLDSTTSKLVDVVPLLNVMGAVPIYEGFESCYTQDLINSSRELTEAELFPIKTINPLMP